jgi:hypothetical protein
VPLSVRSPTCVREHSMSGKAMTETKVAISIAPTNRSKCQQCKEGIQKDETRVSMPGRHNGLTVTRWLHPSCFATNCIELDFAPTGRGHCTSDGREIAKGAARLVMRIRNCEGKTSSQLIWHPPNASGILGDLEAACDDFSIEDLCGTVDDPAHREWFSDALKGSDVSRREVPTLVAKPTAGQKRKKTEAQAEDEEGEAID